MLPPALYLIPVEIGDSPLDMTIPSGNLRIVREIRTFIVENLRTARRCLRRWDREFPIDACTFHELAHWSVIRALGGRVVLLRLSCAGAEMRLSAAHPLSPGGMLLAAVAGPAQKAGQAPARRPGEWQPRRIC